MRKIRTPAIPRKSGGTPVDPGFDVEPTVAIIQSLIPLGLQAVEDALQVEVTRLVGPRYSRQRVTPDVARWGRQRGSVYLSDQKVPLTVPRVRNTRTRQEVPLATYHRLQQPQAQDTALVLKVLHGLSCHRYAPTAKLVPEVFGLSASSVSRRFIRASARALRAFQHRRLDAYECVGLILDGKTFAEDVMVIAVGVTVTGEKIFLGTVQTATENKRVCRQFLQSLVDRGFRYQQGLLCVIDGAKGLRKALTEVFASCVVIQRCQWHKRENVVAYLPKSQQAGFRQRLQHAYEQPTYDAARKALRACRNALAPINQSAVASLEEGLEDTLTLHRLGVFPQLGVSLKTTNCLESINAQLARMLHRITAWKNSQQKQRWLATALLDIEPRLRRIKGYRYLPQLQQAIQRELKIETQQAA